MSLFSISALGSCDMQVNCLGKFIVQLQGNLMKKAWDGALKKCRYRMKSLILVYKKGISAS